MTLRKIVTFDFDGVLHSSVIPNTLHPICFRTMELWHPRRDMFNLLFDEALDNDVYIVTSRCGWNKPEILQFVEYYGLPITRIVCGNDEPKAPILIQLGSVRHYDDDDRLEKPLQKAGIEFILSKPPHRPDLVEDYGSFQ